MYCCPNCFNDSFLQSEIEARSSLKGKCSFCSAGNVSLIEPIKLQDLFTPVLDIYEENENGRSLFKVIQEDWNIFSLPEETQRKLLDNISQLDTSLNRSPSLDKKKWDNFREELKHENRFFVKNAPSITLIEHFAGYLGKPVKKGSIYLYRAKINLGDNPKNHIDIAKMGKPPLKKSTNGRANPIGISYLYLASSPETAISEIKGYKGEIVTVAKFKIKADLMLADLRDPKTTITPFGLENQELEDIYTNLPLMEMLGQELTKPIIPREAHLEYLLSQYLSEMIKCINFHGIMYKGSVSNGDNLVLFDDDKVEAIKTQLYQITDIITKSSKFS